MATGYRLFIDTGAAGPTVGDGISASQTLSFDPAAYAPVVGAYISYPSAWSVEGIVYFVSGSWYFVPNHFYEVPAGETGTIAVTQAPSYLTSGTDTYTGTSGNNLIFGGPTQDPTGTGNDTINGGGGDDQIIFGDGNDVVHGGDGNDVIGSFESARSGTNTLYGDAGADQVYGGDGTDTIWGGTGDDYLTGGAGSDFLHGDDGADVFAITDDHDADQIWGGEGGTDFDAIAFANNVSSQGVVVTFTGFEAGGYDYIATATAGSFVEIEAIYGTVYADAIDAGASAAGHTLAGGAGDDAITGGAGDDSIHGGDGADS